MNRKEHFVFALRLAALNLFTATHAFEVHLVPRDQARHISESFELTCTVSGCLQEASFLWKTSTDSSPGGKIETNQTVSRQVFSKLTKLHENLIICKVNCGFFKENKTKLRIYSFPSDPVISRVDALKLKCVIQNVYPASMFKIQWLRGDTTISDTYDMSFDDDVVQDMHSFYTLTEVDLGKNITCKVTLSMHGVPDDRALRRVTVQYGPAFISVSNYTTVRQGERLELRCDTDRESNITWTKLEKNGAVVLGKDRELVFENADWSHAGEYECEAGALLGSRRSKVNVTVQGPPKVPKISLSQMTDPREGDNITIFCDSDSFPSARLTIFGSSLNYSSDQASMSINIPSIQLKDSGIYHCEARNEFGKKTSSIDIMVQEWLSVAPNLTTAIVPAVSSVSLLGGVAVLIRFLRKIRKTSQNIAVDALDM